MEFRKKSLRRGAVRVALQAIRPEIESRLAAGMTASMIYDELRNKIPTTVEWFRTYVSREITKTAGSKGGRVPARFKKASQPPAPTNSNKVLGEIRPIHGSTKPPTNFGDLGKIDLHAAFGVPKPDEES